MSKGDPVRAANVSEEELTKLITMAEAFHNYATSLGIPDVLVDNNYRNFVAIRMLGLTPTFSPGNDAIDEHMREFESKTLVLPQKTFTSSRRITHKRIDRMEQTHGWIYTTFIGAIPQEQIGVLTEDLKESYFKPWRERLNTSGASTLDQPTPKMKLSHIKQIGYQIYPFKPKQLLTDNETPATPDIL